MLEEVNLLMNIDISDETTTSLVSIPKIVNLSEITDNIFGTTDSIVIWIYGNTEIITIIQNFIN
jgi:hypothetical protein